MWHASFISHKKRLRHIVETVAFDLVLKHEKRENWWFRACQIGLIITVELKYGSEMHG